MVYLSLSTAAECPSGRHGTLEQVGGESSGLFVLLGSDPLAGYGLLKRLDVHFHASESPAVPAPKKRGYLRVPVSRGNG